MNHKMLVVTGNAVEVPVPPRFRPLRYRTRRQDGKSSRVSGWKYLFINMRDSYQVSKARIFEFQSIIHNF